MPLTLIFEAHGTTFDNEAEHAIFCSDLERAYRSAEIGFGTRWPIVKDARLRECNYGDLTQKPADIVGAEKPKHISLASAGPTLWSAIPNGESYTQTTARMKSFLDDLPATLTSLLKLRSPGKSFAGQVANYRVMVIGHRATQYCIEHVVNGVPLQKLVTAHFKWQPGWRYEV